MDTFLCNDDDKRPLCGMVLGKFMVKILANRSSPFLSLTNYPWIGVHIFFFICSLICVHEHPDHFSLKVAM